MVLPHKAMKNIDSGSDNYLLEVASDVTAESVLTCNFLLTTNFRPCVII